MRGLLGVRMRKARHEHMWSGLAQRSDLTADMLNWQQRANSGHSWGAAVVASGRDANRVVAAHLPPTEPRDRSVTLTCYISWPE
jgi:hypothetical protein